MRIVGRPAVIFIAVALWLVACSTSDDSSAVPTTDVTATSNAVSTPDTVETTTVERIDTETTETTVTVPGTDAGSIATVAEEGVPGIDSVDPFCRGWSEFAGSFQALAFASMAGGDPATATRLEVVAAPAVLDAVSTIDQAFPDEIADEREVFVGDLLGPFTRRAERLRDELRAAGLDDAEIKALGALWLETLVASGVDDPEISVEVPGALQSRLDAAVAAVRASVPAIGDDPSLVVDASAPATLSYIATNCPDQGTLGGNDVID